MLKIACVIVTYNRLGYLKNCLEGVANQTFKPHSVYIVDNHSTDGTDEWVEESGYNKRKNNIEYIYLRLDSNTGGSGGFYTGIKSAHSSPERFDGIWVMDDDGCPSPTCLQELVAVLGKYDYIAPIVLSDKDKKTCSFRSKVTYEEFCIKADENGIVYNYATPFNGILYSRKLVDTIGYPKKEMFIWGDEYNYHLRAINSGMYPVTLVKAIHYHPMNRLFKVKLSRFRARILITDQDWRLYFFLRNSVYNSKFETSFIRRYIKPLSLLEAYCYYYAKEKQIEKIKLVINAFYCGLVGDFSKTDKYIPK